MLQTDFGQALHASLAQESMPFKERYYRPDLVAGVAVDAMFALRSGEGFARALREVGRRSENVDIICEQYPVTIRRDMAEYANLRIVYDIRIPMLEQLNRQPQDILESVAELAFMNGKGVESVLILAKPGKRSLWETRYCLRSDGKQFNATNRFGPYNAQDMAGSVMTALRQLVRADYF